MAKFKEHVVLYQRTSYSELTASLWLSLRLQVYLRFQMFAVSIKCLQKLYKILIVTFDVDMLKLSSYSEGIVNHVTRPL